MSKMIQIRNVPDDVHATLKARAAKAGMSLSEYLLAQVQEFANRPTIEEIGERIRRLPPVGPISETPAEIIRRHRDGA